MKNNEQNFWKLKKRKHIENKDDLVFLFATKAIKVNHTAMKMNLSNWIHLFVLAHRCINSSKYKCIISPVLFQGTFTNCIVINKTSSKDLVMILWATLSTHFLLLICTSIIHFNFGVRHLQGRVEWKSLYCTL